MARRVWNTHMMSEMKKQPHNWNKPSKLITQEFIEHWARITIEHSRNLTEEQIEDRTATLTDYILSYLKKQFKVTVGSECPINGITYVLTIKTNRHVRNQTSTHNKSSVRTYQV